MKARPTEVTDEHIFFILWLVRKHPHIKFSKVCNNCRHKITGQLIFPKGVIREFAQQKRQRFSESLAIPPDYPPDYDPFESLLRPQDFPLFYPTSTTSATSQRPTTSNMASAYSLEIPDNMDQDEFISQMLSMIAQRNPDDPKPNDVEEMKTYADREDFDPLSAMLKGKGVAKHFTDVASRDGERVGTVLSGRIGLLDVNERSNEADLSLQTFTFGKSDSKKSLHVQLIKLSELIDSDYAHYILENTNEIVAETFGANTARNLFFGGATKGIAGGEDEDDRYINHVTYHLLPNKRDGKSIKYCNQEHNEEFVGDDETTGEPTFGTSPPDDEYMNCPVTISRGGFQVGGDAEEGGDDENLADAGAVVGTSMATIAFQLAVVDSFRGKAARKSRKKKQMTPPRGLGSVFVAGAQG